MVKLWENEEVSDEVYDNSEYYNSDSRDIMIIIIR